jgi:hypothetical protein
VEVWRGEGRVGERKGRNCGKGAREAIRKAAVQDPSVVQVPVISCTDGLSDAWMRSVRVVSRSSLRVELESRGLNRAQKTSPDVYGPDIGAQSVSEARQISRMCF